jgi:hypothetical protein
VEHVDVWAATIEDRPGDLANVLAELREAGADLQFIIARRAEPGKGVVFVTPLRGDREIAAAAQVGFNVTHTLHSVRVIGRDRPGIAAELTQNSPGGFASVINISTATVDRWTMRTGDRNSEKFDKLCRQRSVGEARSYLIVS